MLCGSSRGNDCSDGNCSRLCNRDGREGLSASGIGSTGRKLKKQLADLQDTHSQEIHRYQSLLEQQETETAELTDRLRAVAVAGSQHEQIGVDADATAADAKEPVAGAEVTEADATATTVRSPTMLDALSGGEESRNKGAVIPPLVSLRSPVLCNPSTLPSLSRFSGNKPGDEKLLSSLCESLHVILSCLNGKKSNVFNLKFIWLGEHYECMSHYIVI